MDKRLVTFGLLAGCLFIVGTSAAIGQTATSVAAQSEPFATIKTSVSTAIGAEDRTVEMKSNRGLLTVTRVNSNMNAATHEGRNSEAKVIAALVAKGIGNDPKLSKVQTIRVEYLVRAAPTANHKIVDSAEFRKGPDRAFDFHQT